MITVLLGIRSVEVTASTLAGALQAAYEKEPALRQLLMDESGSFREHVLCYHRTAQGAASTRWMATLNVPLTLGDSILIMQAVSGG